MCYARIDCSRNEGNVFSCFLVFITDQKTQTLSFFRLFFLHLNVVYMSHLEYFS
jgi:hypothetical protein